MSESAWIDRLNASLRSVATRAAELADGGCALVFASLPGSQGSDPASRLRAAAGFSSADEARHAAGMLIGQVQQCLSEAQPERVPPSPALGERGSGGVWILPLCFEERTLGALVVGMPRSANDPDLTNRLARLAESTALRLDHARLTYELDGQREPSNGSGGDELLKLSEALFAQDIELLRSNEKLGKIEKLKNDFIEKMSLELRTPLNSIIEAIISVLAGENEQISESSKESLRGALDEGTAFQRTLQNILDLWRIRQGELPVEIQEVNVVEVVEEAIFSVQDTLGDKPVSIETHFEEPLPKLKTDLAKANQLVFMLLDNAAKFTHEGRIQINVHLSEDSHLVCEVRDSGIGICPDDQQFVFDAFFQVDEHSSPKYRGAGLGLALVRDLVMLLDGDIALNSEAGKGTTVSLRIPVQPLG